MNLNAMTDKIKQTGPKRVAVAAAQDDAVLKAVSKAYELGIAVPILCGDKAEITGAAKACGVDVSPFEIVDTKSGVESAAAAVALVKDGRADILMKGLLQTSDLLRAVLDKEKGLRGAGLLSHVAALRSDAMDRTWLCTDGAMVMYPDLTAKVQLIKNALTVAAAIGIEVPKVAVLAAVEVINPKMQATLDAAELTAMNKRGEIPECIVEGPLAFDLAVSHEAARHKGVKSGVAGQADILLFHNIEAANSTVKAMTNIGGCLFGGMIVGAAAPIVLTSRSDSDESKLYSIALAGLSVR